MSQSELLSSGGPAATWKDEKRYWWWLPLFVAVSPMLGIYLTYRTGHEGWTWITAALWYVILPVADAIAGRDSRNPPEEAVAALEADPWYKGLLWSSVPIFYITWIVGAWAVAALHYSWVGYLGVAFGVALTNGLALVVGHEIGHKNRPFEKR